MPTSQPTAFETAALHSLPAFRSWTANAKPGERLLYHRGFLALDRVRGLSRGDQSGRKRLATIADRIFALADRGKLHLIQERHGDADYAYWAIVKTQHGRRP